jgi:hypothetical protein
MRRFTTQHDRSFRLILGWTRVRLAAVERLCDTEKAQEAGVTTAVGGVFKVFSTVSGAVAIY